MGRHYAALKINDSTTRTTLSTLVMASSMPDFCSTDTVSTTPPEYPPRRRQANRFQERAWWRAQQLHSHVSLHTIKLESVEHLRSRAVSATAGVSGFRCQDPVTVIVVDTTYLYSALQLVAVELELLHFHLAD